MKRETTGESDLHAFVDGELANGRLDGVRAHLDANPADAARVESWRRQNAAIRRAFEPVVRDLPPRRPVDKEALRPGLGDAPPRLDLVRAARRRRRAMATLAVFLGGACVALLGAVAFSRFAIPPEQSFESSPSLAPAAQARRARLAWRSYAREVDRFFDRPVTDRAATAAALQRATALPRVPDLSRDGFELVAVRTMPGEAEPAAFLLYESPAHVRVGLIVERTPEPDSSPVLSDDGGLRCLSWRAAGYSFSLVGPADPDTLRALGRATVTTFAGR